MKVHPIFDVRAAASDRQWGFAYLKLDGWVLQMWPSEREAHDHRSNQRPDGWIDLRAGRGADRYQTIERDQAIYPYAVVCTFADGKLEFRTKTPDMSREWLQLIRRVQFEAQDVVARRDDDDRAHQLMQLESVLAKVVYNYRRGFSSRDAYGQLYDLYNDGLDGDLSLGGLSAVLRDLLEIRKRRLSTFLTQQYRILNSRPHNGMDGGNANFEALERNANVLFAKYQQKLSVSSLGNEAVGIRTLCDSVRNGSVNKEEFMRFAELTIFNERDIQEEIAVRRLGVPVICQDSCLTQ